MKPAAAPSPSWHQLLSRLDHLPGEYRDGVQKAIRIADEDAEMALTRSRKVLESVVREIYERRLQEPPGTRPLENLLQRLAKDSFIPDRINAFANNVRVLGNVGTHTFDEQITASDVHRSLTDLVEILHWYIEVERPAVSAPPPLPIKPATTAGPSRPLAIVPKGLRSFDAADADFFLDLLPGPRDKDGLPESIRFWKHRIDSTEKLTFIVGVIYGPSGCGKSSLVKAGLLPRLASKVLSVYVEATAADTEVRLLKGLRKHCPGLPGDLDLVGSIAALRQGVGLPTNQKVFIVLDQFEQWLHAKRAQENTELAQALRQCDGEHVQCVVMVRDDFWLAVSRFMGDLCIELLQGQNIALVDLFDLRHAKKVLTAFGQAFGALSEPPAANQEAFLDQAVTGLAQDGRVISVRLALFAEMIKGKPWTLATLKEVGGTEGVGVTFLEETFASAKNRPYQEAARAVLKALLPEQGTDIKGNMQSQDKLLLVSEYVRRPKEFEELLRLLDSEVRLITPTDPEGVDAGSTAVTGERSYQLTHDYLVPSVREWLTCKQKQTRRGRAELRLSERTALWTARPENHQLPAWWEWANIRLLTRQRAWTAPQHKMMRKAGRYHALRGGLLGVCLALLSWGGWEGFGYLKAQTLLYRLQEAITPDVPGIVKDMAPYRRWVDPLLKDAYTQAKEDRDHRKQLHTSLALLPVDKGQVEYLQGRLLEAEAQAQEVTVIREALFLYRADLSEPLWAVLEDRKADIDRRFRAACALAIYTPDDTRWEKVNADVAARLVSQNAFVIGTWAKALQPVAEHLLPPLASFLGDEERNSSERGVIATLYKRYAESQAKAYTRLEKVLAEQGQPDASLEDKAALVKRQANVGVALVAMEQGGKVWPLLKHTPDPTLRSFLIDRLASGGVDAKVLLGRFDQKQDVSIQRAILLSLAECGRDRLPVVERQNLVPRLVQLYREHPDAGIHGATEWLLRQWGVGDKLKAVDGELATGQVIGQRQWYINRQGQTLVVIPGPVEFMMGSPLTEVGRYKNDEERHKESIRRSYAIATKDVTVREFLQFRKDHEFDKTVAQSSDSPVHKVSWYDAAAYCNWLSEREGLTKDQWCYEPNAKEEYAEGMKLAADYLQRTGYRLLTEGEWEYACRARADTRFSFGDPEDLLDRYAWFSENSKGKCHTVGSLRPNDLGLFDMHGNVWQLCLDIYGKAKGSDVHVKDWDDRVLRGGSLLDQARHVRCASRYRLLPAERNDDVGFRAARTLPFQNSQASLPVERARVQGPGGRPESAQCPAK